VRRFLFSKRNFLDLELSRNLFKKTFSKKNTGEENEVFALNFCKKKNLYFPPARRRHSLVASSHRAGKFKPT